MSNTTIPSDPDNVALPSTLAGLLEAAILDARSLDRNIYVPYHDEWHHASNHNYCEVCLGGALMAGTLNLSPRVTLSPHMLSHETEVKLDALDFIRCGLWKQAFDLIHNRVPSRAISDLLFALPAPPFGNFTGWIEFNAHLDSLEELLPALRNIDQHASKL